MRIPLFLAFRLAGQKQQGYRNALFFASSHRPVRAGQQQARSAAYAR
jgi:hypothetical protein